MRLYWSQFRALCIIILCMHCQPLQFTGKHHTAQLYFMLEVPMKWKIFWCFSVACYMYVNFSKLPKVNNVEDRKIEFGNWKYVHFAHGQNECITRSWHRKLFRWLHRYFPTFVSWNFHQRAHIHQYLPFYLQKIANFEEIFNGNSHGYRGEVG